MLGERRLENQQTARGDKPFLTMHYQGDSQSDCRRARRATDQLTIDIARPGSGGSSRGYVSTIITWAILLIENKFFFGNNQRVTVMLRGA
ncbi:hypothetical protein [Massilia scottii]|uniref:hypothetical protein n=1 Tax=Massilia scottii TaxID=3057166 RepID=UPI00279647B8|nr:hypothetical protein [Massilia sp. CCM 9029]MDQ1831089.1 hypothetical protein [Massilia sp. CCM 9029]